MMTETVLVGRVGGACNRGVLVAIHGSRGGKVGGGQQYTGGEEVFSIMYIV